MLEIKNINYTIAEKTILQNINLQFQDGEITVITGGNGSGKSTLFNIIMGILHQDSGEIMLDNQNISDDKVDERAKKSLSLAFQQPVKFKGITVKKLLEIAQNKVGNINSACEELSKVGLCARNYIDREFNDELSGGERKRIELALSLAQDAKNCLFDEPEAGIDMWSFDALTEIFENLKKQGKCVVIISHNQKILEMADKVVVLNGGKIEYFGVNDGIENILPSACVRLKGDLNG